MILAEATDRTFGFIPPPDAEPQLFGKNFGAYQDDQKWGFCRFEDEFEFLMFNFFPRVEWSRFGTSYKKFRCCMDTIQGLGISVRAGGMVKIVEDRVQKITSFPRITNKTEALRFVGVVQITHPHFKNFTEMILPSATNALSQINKILWVRKINSFAMKLCQDPGFISAIVAIGNAECMSSLVNQLACQLLFLACGYIHLWSAQRFARYLSSLWHSSQGDGKASRQGRVLTLTPLVVRYRSG